MAELRELEASADILRRVRLIITAAARRKTPAAEGDGISLFGELFRAFRLETNTRIAPGKWLLACAQTMSFAVGNQRMSTEWLCKLQSLLCGPRSTEAGPYKQSPNYMTRHKGRARSGAPVAATAQEMARYVRELRSKKFLESHPVLQASYSHYSLVLIHPFFDGNGRVARSLAAAYLYRPTSIPLLSLAQERGAYLSSLRAADTGDFQEFINLVEESSIVSAARIKSSILAAMKLSRGLHRRPASSMPDGSVLSRRCA